MPRRQRRPAVDSDTARRRILEGAAQLFMEQGFHATSVRELGERLNISQSSLYYHAKNKAQILVDLNNDFMDDLVGRMESIAAEPAPGIDRLGEVIRQLLQTIAVHQPNVTVVLHERRSLPRGAAKSVQRKRDRVDEIIDGIIEAGIEDGTIREVPVVLLRLALTGMANWAYTWFHADGSLSEEEIAAVFIDLLRHGVDPPGDAGS
jgi:AcrR family transcriptional regulator